MDLVVIDANDVHLIGRLAKEPEHKTMPSGDAAVNFRIVVRRPQSAVRRQPIDSIECTSYRAAAIKAAAGWRPGDVLELTGALRRRIWRLGPETRSAYSVEVRTVRRVSRAATPRAAKGRRPSLAAEGAG